MFKQKVSEVDMVAVGDKVDFNIRELWIITT